jgi:hypothetical protein
MTDYGWTAHLDKRGTPCAYCGEPSTETFVVEPDQYRNHEPARRGKRIGVCDEHKREPENPTGLAMRRHAKGVEQMSLDVGDESRGDHYGEAA